MPQKATPPPLWLVVASQRNWSARRGVAPAQVRKDGVERTTAWACYNHIHGNTDRQAACHVPYTRRPRHQLHLVIRTDHQMRLVHVQCGIKHIAA